MAGSCRKCEHCDKNQDGSITYGGYADIMVAEEDFVIRWPDNFPMDRGAPLVCAGITTYSPLRYYGLDKPGLHVGVAGLGGLGHVAVKFLKAFGAKGKLVVVGLPEKPLQLPMFALATHRKMIGREHDWGIKETQEMIDFAAKHNILPDVEIISMDYVNTAMERLARADVKYRFVIDVGKTLKKTDN
ncbi:geraniol dehydrogenase 1 [Phtheirospermum japonicum]|uniref:Geraniol dehydrogenase 1 n=1 Tax=Phtheirospermum japonicum TaxID=374723 RepID=A0A830BJE9_9LAMI|nr:geraniol dehydrogenase 1 [Phtheirospermum japonicum]